MILKALTLASNVKILGLDSNNMSGMVLSDLADTIKANVHLEQLGLENNNLQSSAIVILQALQGLSRLKKLNFNGNNMSMAVAVNLAEVIKRNKHLEELGLRSNNLQLSAGLILKSLKATSKIKVLNLNNNNMTEEITEEVADAIKVNNKLQEFYIGNNNFLSSISKILQALSEISKLKGLNLAYNDLSEGRANKLACIIEHNSSLANLYLNGCNLHSPGFIIISQVLQRNHSLKLLSINGNHLTSTAVYGLVSVVKNNHFIEELWLGDNNLKGGLLEVTNCCCFLKKLKALELSHNCIDVNEVNNLAMTVSKISSIEALMLGGISLNADENFCVNITKICEAKNCLKAVLLS